MEFVIGKEYQYDHPRFGPVNLVFRGRTEDGGYRFKVADWPIAAAYGWHHRTFPEWEMALPAVQERFIERSGD